MEFLLDTFVDSIGFVLKNVVNPLNPLERQPKKGHLWLNQTSCTEILKYLIHRFPPLIIYLLEYKISSEIIASYYCKPTILYTKIQNKINLKDGSLDFINFLYVIYPYSYGVSQQLLIVLFSEIYYYKMIELDGLKLLVSSADIWKYEILMQIIKEFKDIIDSNKFLKDANVFFQFQHMIHVFMVILSTSEMNTFKKEFHELDDFVNKEMYEICLKIFNECKESYQYSLLTVLGGIFFTLFKKIHNRIIKSQISNWKKTSYQKGDIRYLRYYYYFN